MDSESDDYSSSSSSGYGSDYEDLMAKIEDKVRALIASKKQLYCTVCRELLNKLGRFHDLKALIQHCGTVHGKKKVLKAHRMLKEILEKYNETKQRKIEEMKENLVDKDLMERLNTRYEQDEKTIKEVQVWEEMIEEEKRIKIELWEAQKEELKADKLSKGILEKTKLLMVDMRKQQEITNKMQEKRLKEIEDRELRLKAMFQKGNLIIKKKIQNSLRLQREINKLEQESVKTSGNSAELIDKKKQEAEVLTKDITRYRKIVMEHKEERQDALKKIEDAKDTIENLSISLKQDEEELHQQQKKLELIDNQYLKLMEDRNQNKDDGNVEDDVEVDYKQNKRMKKLDKDCCLLCDKKFGEFPKMSEMSKDEKKYVEMKNRARASLSPCFCTDYCFECANKLKFKECPKHKSKIVYVSEAFFYA